jgi:hypothetical protein
MHAPPIATTFSFSCLNSPEDAAVTLSKDIAHYAHIYHDSKFQTIIKYISGEIRGIISAAQDICHCDNTSEEQ